MEKITTLVVDGSSYALSDPTRLPQPEDALVGGLLQVKTLENGTVSQVTTLMPETISGKVKTVNGAQPDEDGNIDVASTCDLEQPRWGMEIREQTQEQILITVANDERGCWAKPMSQEEYNQLMAKATEAYLADAAGERVCAVALEDISHEYYDYYPGDSEIPCLRLSYVKYADYNSWDYYLQIIGQTTAEVTHITRIPAQYLDMGDIAAALDHIIALQEELMA